MSRLKGGGLPPKRGGPPWGPGTLPERGVGASYCDFFAISVPFFFSSFFRCLFRSILARFSTPTCLPKSTKIHEKSMPRCLPKLTSFFDRFLIAFCSQLGPLEPHFSSPRCRESTIFQKIAFRNRHPFWIDLGANLPPFSFPKSTKIASKTDLERHRFFDRFWHRFFHDFCSIWEANLGPCWPHFRLKWGG